VVDLKNNRITRPKFPKELRFAILNEIVKHPEISSTQIMMNLIGKDHRNAIFFYRKPLGDSFSLDDLYTIFKAGNKKEAKELYHKLIKNNTGNYELNPGVITYTKTWLNKNNAPKNPGTAIYGATGLGYVIEKDLNPNRAARWLYPRFRQQQHECMHTLNAIKVINRGADSPERKKVATLLLTHGARAVVYKRIKACGDGLRDEFFHKRS
jgi:hypothetical protein